MNLTPRTKRSFKIQRPHTKLIAAALAMGLLMTACSADPVDSVAAVEAIETNGGAIAVKPPDVLNGEADTSGDVTIATTVPIEPADETSGTTGSDGADADTVAGDSDAAESGLLPIPQNEFVWFDGTPGSTDDFAGQPTVLNFWSSNCAACVAEMADFEEVFQELGGRVAFVGMNRDDTREFALQLADETGVTYPLAEDLASKMFFDFRAFAMPTTVFLTEANDVAFIWQGGLTSEDLLLLIDQHLNPGNT